MKMKKKKTKRRSSSSSNPINGSDSSTFHVSIATTAVAQICHSLGFESTQTTALQTLTDITVRYLASIATSAATSAASTGRTECNLYDVIRGLEEVHADVGFKGNSAVARRLSESEMLKDLMTFVEWSREIPFAKSLRTFPMVTSLNGEKREVNDGKSECEVVPRGKCNENICKNVFTAVNEGKNKSEVMSSGKRMLTSLYGECNGNERLGKTGEKSVLTAVNEGKSEGEVMPGEQIIMSRHIPKWLPEFPNGGEKQVFTAEVNVEGKKSEGEKEKVNYYDNKEASELPELRKKVSFEIRRVLKRKSRGKEVIKVKLRGVNLKSGVGVCKGGKRILCQIYQDLGNKGDYDVVKSTSMVKMKYSRR